MNFLGQDRTSGGSPPDNLNKLQGSPGDSKQWASRRSLKFHTAFWCIILFGAALRFAWLGCGLPKVEYVDAFKFVDAADAMARAGNFEPRDFQNPALLANVLALADRVFHLDTSPYAEHLAARLLSAIAGIVLIWLVWRAGREVLSPASALLAAALVAVSVDLVTLSRYPLSDMILTMFMTAGLVCALKENPRWNHLLGAGVFLGLAVATKWTSLYLVVFYFVLTAIRMFRRELRLQELSRLGAILLIAAVVFIAVNPHFISHFSDYFQRFRLESEIQKYGQIGRIQGGWLDYFISSTPTWEMPWLSTSLLHDFGPVLLVAVFAGLVVALVCGKPWPLALHALYVAIYLALIIRPGHLKAIRFLAPALPSLFILAASVVDRFCEFFSAHRRQIVVSVTSLVLIAFPLFRSARFVSSARLPMTPVLAEDWICKNLPDETAICVSPFFLNNLESLPHKPLFMQNIEQRQYRLPDNPAANGELNPIYAPELLEALRSQGVHYYICNSWFENAFLPVPENLQWFPKATAAYASWRQRLEAEGQLVWSVRPAETGCLGPDVEIWRLER